MNASLLHNRRHNRQPTGVRWVAATTSTRSRLRRLRTVLLAIGARAETATNGKSSPMLSLTWRGAISRGRRHRSILTVPRNRSETSPTRRDDALRNNGLPEQPLQLHIRCGTPTGSATVVRPQAATATINRVEIVIGDATGAVDVTGVVTLNRRRMTQDRDRGAAAPSSPTNSMAKEVLRLS